MFVTRGIVSYGIVAEVTGPSYLQVRMYLEIRPEFLFLSPEFRTKLILPWNDLTPTCVPPEPGNSAEYPEFRKMRPGRNRNKKRNAHPSLTSGVIRRAPPRERLARGHGP